MSRRGWGVREGTGSVGNANQRLTENIPNTKRIKIYQSQRGERPAVRQVQVETSEGKEYKERQRRRGEGRKRFEKYENKAALVNLGVKWIC